MNEEFEARINEFSLLFEELQETNSRIDKDYLIHEFKKSCPEYVDDLLYIFETLDGQHPLGYTFVPSHVTAPSCEFKTIRALIEFLISKRFHPSNLSLMVGYYGEFIAPIVNRTLRLGIGKSMLPITSISPMLAKKYEGQDIPLSCVTEKLDGNRCIAQYDFDTEEWVYMSRNGKRQNVSFDMSKMDKSLTYDGEIMTRKQTDLSRRRYDIIMNNAEIDTSEAQDTSSLFNEASGLINRKYETDKDLVYNVFDYVSPRPYIERRNKLSEFKDTDTVRILPPFGLATKGEPLSMLLDDVVTLGGEGIMLNDCNAPYIHKRTKALLKYKQVQHMDMRVTDILPGTGKYEGQVGALCCEITTDDGKYISCSVGSGLSDKQRYDFSINSESIIGSIVEVAYHEITSNKMSQGTYSLRFPRLIKIRDDKSDTSEY